MTKYEKLRDELIALLQIAIDSDSKITSVVLMSNTRYVVINTEDGEEYDFMIGSEI